MDRQFKQFSLTLKEIMTGFLIRNPKITCIKTLVLSEIRNENVIIESSGLINRAE